MTIINCKILIIRDEQFANAQLVILQELIMIYKHCIIAVADFTFISIFIGSMINNIDI